MISKVVHITCALHLLKFYQFCSTALLLGSRHPTWSADLLLEQIIEDFIILSAFCWQERTLCVFTDIWALTRPNFQIFGIVGVQSICNFTFQFWKGHKFIIVMQQSLPNSIQEAILVGLDFVHYPNIFIRKVIKLGKSPLGYIWGPERNVNCSFGLQIETEGTQHSFCT